MSAMTRRKALKVAGAAAAAAACPPAVRAMSRVEPRTADQKPRPNIVIMLADDMGFSDIGCYGSEIRTPNLDRMAANGLRFSQFYNCARCCPTRAALLTGLYPHQTAVGHMIDDYHFPGYRGYLNERCATIAEVLRPAGYTTLLSGKWHVGEQRPHWPCDRGFDEFYGLISGANSYWRLDPGRVMARNNEPITPPSDGFYMTDAISDNAVQFLQQHGRGEKPFFLYLAYTAPHWPLHAWEDDITSYLDVYRQGWDAVRAARHRRLLEAGIMRKEWALPPLDGTPWAQTDDRDELVRRMAVYAAQVARMDAGIGRVMAALDTLGQADNTLVLFLSDNGGCAEIIERSARPAAPTGSADSFRSYGRTWANVSNTPLQRYKQYVHEGGIATPLVAHWPRGIRAPGRLEHQPGHVIDILPTCLDVAGVAYPRALDGRALTPLEGISFAPVFADQPRREHDVLYWEHQGNRAVRAGDWKLLAERGESPQWALHNIAQDRTELHDLAAAQPARVKELNALYEQWAQRCQVLPFDAMMKARG
jgi:arylsulfatase